MTARRPSRVNFYKADYVKLGDQLSRIDWESPLRGVDVDSTLLSCQLYLNSKIFSNSFFFLVLSHIAVVVVVVAFDQPNFFFWSSSFTNMDIHRKNFSCIIGFILKMNYSELVILLIFDFVDDITLK